MFSRNCAYRTFPFHGQLVGGDTHAKSLMKWLRRLLPLLFFALDAPVPNSGRAAPPTIIPLSDSASLAISSNGQVTGVKNGHAFLYTGGIEVTGEFFDLGTLGGTDSEGYGINFTGQVVGESDTASGTTHAFLYTGVPGEAGRWST